MTIRQLKSSEITLIREQILEDQNGRCAICDKEITEETGVALDHQHMTKKETIGEDGAGLIRGVLCRACNCVEGKAWNNMNRYLQPKNVQERIDYLKNLIAYYEKDTYQLVHPLEKPKEQVLSKRNYAKLKKAYQGKKKFPEYPKSSKLTLALQLLFEEYGINPYN